MVVSRYQNAGQNYYIKIAGIPFENAAKLKYLGTTVSNQNYIHKKIKRAYPVHSEEEEEEEGRY
jgi:hypothetical protein